MTTRTPADYDASVYRQDEGEAWTKVEWRPADGPKQTAVGDYVEVDADGAVWLGCGCEAAVSALGLEGLMFGPENEDKFTAVCDELSRQLQKRPWAELRCPSGRLTVDLVRAALAPPPMPLPLDW